MTIRSYLKMSSWKHYILLYKKCYYIWIEQYIHDPFDIVKYVKNNFVIGIRRCKKLGYNNFNIGVQYSYEDGQLVITPIFFQKGVKGYMQLLKINYF